MKKIGILFGGSSVEHEISIITAMQLIENINREKYEVIPIYITKKNEIKVDLNLQKVEKFADLKEIDKLPSYVIVKKDNKVILQAVKKKMMGNKEYAVDMFFMANHGTDVEDGTLSGVLNLCDVPFVGPSVLSGAIGQDKAVMRDILCANKIAQVEYLWFTDAQDISEIEQKIITELKLPVIIKPSSLGSSVGIEVCWTADELTDKIKKSFKFDTKIVVEKLIEDFEEYNISVVGNYQKQMTSVVEQVLKEDEILSYEDKYLSGGKVKSQGMAGQSRIIPAPLSEEIIQQMDEIAIKTYQVLNARGVVRIDLMVVEGQIFVNEINSIPGSLSYYLWQHRGKSYSDLIDILIDDAINEFFHQQKKVKSFDTNVLKMQGKGSSK